MMAILTLPISIDQKVIPIVSLFHNLKHAMFIRSNFCSWLNRFL